MKTYCFTTLLFLVSCFNLSAQVKFQKTYGGVGFDFGTNCKITPDGGAIVTGGMGTPASSRPVMFLMRLDMNGDTLWMKTYDDSDDSGGRSVDQTSDGGFVVTGFSNYSNTIIVWKTNSTGDLLWTKGYYYGFSSEGESIMETSDHGFLVCGYGGNAINLVKTNDVGDTLWTRIISPNAPCRPYTLCETTSGKYAVAGYTSTSANGTDFFLLTLDASGTPLSFSTYGGTGDEQCFSLIETLDHGFMLAGRTVFNLGNPYDDALLIKTNASGAVEWASIYGDAIDEYAYDVKQVSDSGFIVTGQKLNIPDNSPDAYLFRINSSGNVMWSKTYGGHGNDQAANVQILSDGGFLLTGTTMDISVGSTDVYLIKTDSLGNSGCLENVVFTNRDTITLYTDHPIYSFTSGMNETTPSFFVSASYAVNTICTTIGIDENNLQNELLIYPNPSSGEFIVRSKNTISSIEIYDQPGQNIYSRKLNSAESTIDLTHFAAGVYFVICHMSDMTIYKKLILN